MGRKYTLSTTQQSEFTIQSLSDEDEAAAASSGAIVVIDEGGNAAPLGRAQAQFNKLIERLRGQRLELERWQTFKRVYQQQLASDYEPLAVRLREKRIAMVKVLDRAMDVESLGKREQKKVREILGRLLSELLAEGEDAELIRIHDRYAHMSFGDERRARSELLKQVAADEYGIDVGAYTGGESPEELTDWLREQVRASRAEPERPFKKKSAKAAQRAALQEQTAVGGTRAVREVFRKLVSELHPDREVDPTEQARKTELMQRVNQAYKAGDLLALLELQLSIEQIDAAALAGLADERLRHYIHVLDEQSRRLREELSELVAPFERVVGEPKPRILTPAAVQRALEADIRKLKAIVRNVEMDLITFKNTRNLRQSLEHYRID